MTQVPHITKEHWDKALDFSRESAHFSMLEAVNKAIEIALAEQAAQEQYITAEQARALGAGNAEFSINEAVLIYDRYLFAKPLRATVTNLSTTNDGVEVVLIDSNNYQFPKGTLFWAHAAQLRKVKQSEQHVPVEPHAELKALTPVSWTDMPVGVMTDKGELREVYEPIYSDESLRASVESSTPTTGKQKFLQDFRCKDVALAPADQQPWIATQEEGEALHEGFSYVKRWSGEDDCQLLAFKVIGIAEGWVLT